MTDSWADRASYSVKADLTALLNTALDVVLSSQNHPLAPEQFLVMMDLDGQITARLGFGGATVGDLIVPFLDDNASLRAVLCVREPGSPPDPTLRAFGDHREASAFDCALTWAKPAGSPKLRVQAFEVSDSAWWLFD
jgi:hypothetical protein